jgi:predicted phage terminase large subunit-like protein
MPFPNEVGQHTPELQKRYLQNPVSQWRGRFITEHRRHPDCEMHLDLYDEFVFGTNDIVMMVPRSFAKTTKTEDFIKYLACNYKRNLEAFNLTGKSEVYPFARVFYTSATGPKAEEVMYHIRQELESNPRILAEYGALQGDTWTNRLIRTKDGFELKIGGRGCQVRGFRPQLFIGDDLEDDEEVASDDQMAKTRQWLDSAVLNTLDETECRGFFIGTVLHPEGALRYLSQKPGFVTKEYWAYKDRIQQPGFELWPSKWSHQRLQEQKAKIGERAFRQEYLNDPMISESPIFMREWFRPYDSNSFSFKELLKQGIYTVITCDPAIARADGADYTALVTMSATFAKEPDIYIRVGGVKRGHWDMGGTVIEIFNLHDKFSSKEVGIETTAYQQALADEFRLYMAAHRRKIQIVEFKPDRDKERRCHAVAPMVERGNVYIDLSDEMSRLLVDECVNFQPGKVNIKKDLMDAMVYGLKMIKDWTSRGSVTNKDIGFGRQATYGRVS